MESLKDKNTTMEEEENEYELKEYHPIEDLQELGINFNFSALDKIPKLWTFQFLYSDKMQKRS